ncbi:MAG: ABC transporter permease [Pseudomonadota bacterium]
MAVLDVEIAPPPKPQKWTKSKIIGTGALAVWIAIGLGIIIHFVTNFDADFFNRYAPRMLGGLGTTLQIVGLSIVIGAALSIPLTWARMSKNAIAGSIAYCYVYFFRGTPLLAQVFLIYYGAGQFRPFFESIGLWWFFRDAVNCAVFAFALNTAAYQAEIYKGAIQALPKGQWEGAHALGLPKTVAFFKVILPQALITALRPLGNEVILMIKGSAIASVITVFDLMGETRLAFSRSFDFQVYIWAALMYLAIVEVLRRIWDWLEIRLTRHLVR